MSIGIHVSKKKSSIHERIKHYKSINMSCFQIFTHGPRNTNENKLDVDEIIKSTHKHSLYIHSSYITNPWNKKPHIFKHTIDQFKRSKQLKSKGVVLHIPKMNVQKVVSTVTKIRKSLIKNNLEDQLIILEMKALKSHPTESYETSYKINCLITELDKNGLSYKEVGICIDTAHIYAGGTEITSFKSANDFLNELNHKWICLIHLNGNEYDSKIRAGDKHAVPFDSKDKIWNGISYKNSGCRAFVDYANKKKIDIILEVKDKHSDTEIKKFMDKIS